MSDAIVFACILIFIVLFSGSPDLIDSAIWGQGHPMLEQIRSESEEDES
jgi:hypothetical protein